MSRNKVHLMSWVVWSLSATFYLYEFFLRVAPSVMVPELEMSFNISAGLVGTLGAAYLWAYTPLQIPIGVLMDWVGGRRSLTLAMLACGAGSLLFGFADQLWLAIVGRVLMGGGSAFAFVGMVYITSHWFPRHMLASLIGFGTALGMLGGMIGEDTLTFAVLGLGWRRTSMGLGFLGIALALITYFVLKREPPAMKDSHGERFSLRELLSGLRVVCRNKYSWLNGIVSLLAYATTNSFAGLWAVSFFQTAYGMDKIEAGFASSLIFFGWLPGAPLMGVLSDRLGRRRLPITICTLMGFVILSLIIYAPHLPIWIAFALMFLAGIFSSGQFLTFTYAIEINPEETKGTATALTNFIVMIGGIILQPLVGYLIWMGRNGDQPPTVADYRFALSCFPIAFLLAFILSLFLKPKKKLTQLASLKDEQF